MTWFPFFGFTQAHCHIAGATNVDILDTDTIIDTITVTDLEAGTYFFWVDVTVALDDDLDVYIKTEGSTVLSEFRINPKQQFLFPWVYGFPLSWDGGSYETTLIMRKQNDGFTATAKFADFMLYRMF
jgi:hypothetical protein